MAVVAPTKRTKDEVEALVRADYEAVKGKAILVSRFMKMNWENDEDWEEVVLDIPQLAFIAPKMDQNSLIRWMDGDVNHNEVCDPYYDISFNKGDEEGISCQVDGPTRCVDPHGDDHYLDSWSLARRRHGLFGPWEVASPPR